MTTKSSPIEKITAQARRIAAMLKAVERGEIPVEDVGGKIAASRARGWIKFAVVMDDKVISIEQTWKQIEATSEEALIEWLVSLMREETGH